MFVKKTKYLPINVCRKWNNNYFMVLQINWQDIWKENADTQIRLIDNFARILENFKHKISIIKHRWINVSMIKLKNILITHLKIKNY